MSTETKCAGPMFSIIRVILITIILGKVHLERKARLVVWGKEARRERFILFSKSGFTDGMQKLALQDVNRCSS